MRIELSHLTEKTTAKRPQVSIGMPVFNGERFISKAIDSLLSQTYGDFELIISDNASTDSTREICEDYTARYNRVRYYHNEENLGAARNYNRLLELAHGEYFKWAAHDDECAPTYLQRCVEILDQHPEVVVCHTETVYIDENDNQQDGDHDDGLDFRLPAPHDRLYRYFSRRYKRCNAVFGVIRASELRKTPLIGQFYSSDQVLLAELALRGQIYRVPEPLFFRRDHPGQIWGNASRSDCEAWFDPSRRGKLTFPFWRLLVEYCKAVVRVPMSFHEKCACFLPLAYWVKDHDGNLARNLLLKKK